MAIDAHLRVGALFAAVWLLMGLAELTFGTIGIGLPVTLLGAAVLVAAGLYAFRSTSPWLATALVAVGAIVGGLGLVWTVIGPIWAVVLIVLWVVDASRASASVG